MAIPQNPQDFVELIRKSGMVDEARLLAFLDAVSRTTPQLRDIGKLAGLLVRDGLLTHFQAEQLLCGKWRGFNSANYQFLERLGSGQQGAVYLGRHREGRRPVAIKVLPAAAAEDPAEVERFSCEVRRSACVHHAAFPRAYDVIQDDRLHFLAMEFIDGSTLHDIVAGDRGPSHAVPLAARPGPMDVFRAAHYVRQAAEGLQHLHEVATEIHGDIEPSNLMLDRKGQIKIIDLGGCAEPHAFTANEQIQDLDNIDARADIFGLGAVFYFLLAGQPPLGPTARREPAPRPIREVRPELPAGLAAILEQMMAPNPDDRHASAAEVVEELAPWTEMPIAAPPEGEMPQHCAAVKKLIGEKT